MTRGFTTEESLCVNFEEKRGVYSRKYVYKDDGEQKLFYAARRVSQFILITLKKQI